MLDVMCVCCTRGTCISYAAEGMDVNLFDVQQRGLSTDRIWEHKKKIPDAQNSIIQRALDADPKWVWMVEEDVQVPPGTLFRMLELADNKNIPVVTTWYNLEGGTPSYLNTLSGELIFAGLGCILIRGSVLQDLPMPWFRTDIPYTPDRVSGKLKPLHSEKMSDYGRLDVHFFAQLHKYGYLTELLDVRCIHWKIRKYGEPNKNDGCHTLESL